jgi:predicted dinucleotide-binding enzyme
LRFAILGTGVVGKTMTARQAGLGHDVMVGTRKIRSPAPILTNMAILHSVPGSRSTLR